MDLEFLLIRAVVEAFLGLCILAGFYELVKLLITSFRDMWGE